MQWLVAIAALVACGDNLADPLETRSGDRLKLHFIEYADGTLEVALDRGFFDAHREEQCWATRFSDGATYCVPIEPASRAHTVYIDAGCTARRIIGEAMYAVHEVWVVDEFLPSNLVRPGPSASVPAQRYELRNGGCHGPFRVEPGRYFEIAEEVSRANFVAIGTTAISVAPGLDFTVAIGADGLQAPRGLALRGLADCELVPHGSGEQRECRPRNVPESTLFNDAACTQPKIVVPKTRPMPAVAMARDLTGCPRYHRVRQRVGPALFRRVDGLCIRTNDSTIDDFQYVLAEPIELPTIALTERVGTGRLHELSLGDTSIPSGEWFDGARGHACAASGLDDDTTLCMPHLVTTKLLYEDDRCTQPQVAELSQCDSGYRFVASPDGFNGFDVHEIGVALTAAHQRHAGQCTPYVQPANATLHRTGDKIPLDDFAAGVIVRER